jgi:hypothetical protein
VIQAQAPTPARRTYRPIVSREALIEHLQWALSVELSTIPPYVCALYSLRDRTTQAARLVRDVVLEEMLHMALVGNLINAIGGTPALVVPRYPGYIPHHAAGGPFIQLQPLSAELAQVVFMAIEKPELDPQAPAEGDEFHTIGQFYKAIEEGFVNCARADPGLFGHDTGRQRTDTYFGAGGGELVHVCDLDSALLALREITEQGEGAPAGRPPYPGEEEFGARDNYGRRADGTWGPIVGTPWEMSHYGKFKQLASGEVAIPAVHPMQPNPSPAELDGPVRRFAELFDACYTVLLHGIERSLGQPGDERDADRDLDADTAFFGVAFPLMQFVLPRLATVLMRTPLRPGADPELGPNAGPGFLLVEPHPAPPEIVASARSLTGQGPDLGVDYGTAWAEALAAVADTFETSAPPRRLTAAAAKPRP